MSHSVNFRLMKLAERGELVQLKKKYWPPNNNCTPEMDLMVYLDNVSGIFYILMSGLAVATIVLVFEMCLIGVKKNHNFFLHV